jgi:acyl-CoA thioesterase YciA
VFVGNLVSFCAEVTRVGRTSIIVSVEVYAHQRSTSEGAVKVTEAELTYVAVGDDRKPRVVPPQS